MTPLALSLRVAFSATLIAGLMGVALAALFTHRRGMLWGMLDGLVHLPLVLPPTVLGYYLLTALGARSPLGAWLAAHGMPLVFTLRGAVTAASVVALPLVVQSSRAALESVPADLIEVARTLGRSPLNVFLTIRLPLAWRGVLAGVALAFARSLGEFGATLMVAGNIPGKTQTLPLAIYDAVQAGDMARANQQAALLTAAAIVLLIAIRRLSTRWLVRT